MVEVSAYWFDGCPLMRTLPHFSVGGFISQAVMISYVRGSSISH